MTVTVASLLAAAASRKAAAAAAAQANGAANGSGNNAISPSETGAPHDAHDAHEAADSLNNNARSNGSATSTPSAQPPRMGRRKQHCPQKTGLNSDGKREAKEGKRERLYAERQWQ